MADRLQKYLIPDLRLEAFLLADLPADAAGFRVFWVEHSTTAAVPGNWFLWRGTCEPADNRPRHVLMRDGAVAARKG